MNKFLFVIQQRRFWAALCAGIALLLRVKGVPISFDAETAVNAIMQLISDFAIIGSIFLPLFSLFNPKNNK